jgi:hypothetical protein
METKHRYNDNSSLHLKILQESMKTKKAVSSIFKFKTSTKALQNEKCMLNLINIRRIEASKSH